MVRDEVVDSPPTLVDEAPEAAEEAAGVGLDEGIEREGGECNAVDSTDLIVTTRWFANGFPDPCRLKWHDLARGDDPNNSKLSWLSPIAGMAEATHTFIAQS